MLSDLRSSAHQIFLRTGLPQLWNSRSGQQRRAVIFIIVFMILVWTYAFESKTPSTPMFFPHNALDRTAMSWHNLIADVSDYKVFTVADNDDTNGKGEGGSSAAKCSSNAPRTATFVEGILKIKSGATAKGRKTYSLSWSAGSITHLTGTLTGPGGRGMELSTLQFWRHGKLYSCDDRTGVVYEVLLAEGVSPRITPRFVLADGDGQQPRGMACEWAALKGDYLVIGSTGKPWSSINKQGAVVIENSDSQWIKLISPAGTIQNVDWREPYEKMRRALGVGANGYVIHQCAMWSSLRQQWFFIPRHVSYTAYKPGDEDHHGSTVIIIADAAFRNIRFVSLGGGGGGGATRPEAGVTDCKFIPNGHDSEILLIKAIEKSNGGGARFESFASIINVDGEVLMDDIPMQQGYKFEGLEIQPILHTEK